MNKMFKRKKDDQSTTSVTSSPSTFQDGNQMLNSNETLSDVHEGTSSSRQIESFSSKECAVSLTKEAVRATQSFEAFNPLIATFLKLGGEIIELYDKAKYNKELCGFLLTRCNCAKAAVEDLEMRKAEESEEFFSKPENLKLFEEFVECMKRIKKFIGCISKLSKLLIYLLAHSIEEDLQRLIKEFDGYMSSLKFSFTIQYRSESMKLKEYVVQIHELLHDVYGISDDKQSQRNLLNGVDLITKRNREFQFQNKNDSFTDLDELEKNEPLLDGKDYEKTEETDILHSKEIQKRTSYKDSIEVFFKELSNNASSVKESAQIEIRKQVNILKVLKNSDHIIRFFGVAKEDSKFYLVTEWMDYGNLYEYYTHYRDNMNWETKIRFALDICRGVTYLHDCEVS